VNLYRSAADDLKTDDRFIADKLMVSTVIGAGTSIFLRSDPLAYTTSTTYVKVKELALSFIVPKTCTLRIVFDLAGDYNYEYEIPTYGYGKIYKNGVAYGTERSVYGPTFVTFTEDLEFTQGDLVQIYAKGEYGYAASVKNFRVQAAFENRLIDAGGRLTVIPASAGFQWGENYAYDTNLYRSAADMLKTDDNFDALALRIGGTEVIDSARILKNIASVLQTLSPTTAFAYSLGTTSLPWDVLHNRDVQIRTVSGEANPKTRLRAGYLEFGLGGATAVDVNLYRAAADLLKTDDNFDCLALRIGGTEVLTSGRVLQNIASFAQHWVPDGADTRNIGSTTAEILNLYIGTAGKIFFRLDQSVNLYGSATDVLKTDDNFDALALRIGGTEVITSARKLQNIASILQHLIPDATDTYSLGSSTVYWLSAYGTNVFSALMRPAGGDNTGNIGLSTVRWARADIVKIYGTVGDPEPLSKPLRGLEDLMNVKFRTDGLPIEATLPTRHIPPKEEVIKHLREEKISRLREAGKSSDEIRNEEVEPTPEEIDATYKRLEDTVNLSHTIGWLIQCLYELNEKVEALEEKMA